MYICNNDDKINNILFVLNEIKQLGIKRMIFDEEFDFTTETNDINTKLSKNCKIMYYENMESFSNCSDDLIRYKTNGSNYRIEIFVSKTNELYANSIKLNSLVFDLNRLPKSISKEETFDKIINTRKENQYIMSSVNLGVGIEDLETTVDKFDGIVNQVNDTETKIELMNVLKSIREDLNKLQIISDIYDQDIISKHDSITQEVLDKEKKQYKKTRESNRKCY